MNCLLLVTSNRDWSSTSLLLNCCYFDPHEGDFGKAQTQWLKYGFRMMTVSGLSGKYFLPWPQHVMGNRHLNPCSCFWNITRPRCIFICQLIVLTTSFSNVGDSLFLVIDLLSLYRCALFFSLQLLSQYFLSTCFLYCALLFSLILTLIILSLLSTDSDLYIRLEGRG